MWMDCRWNLDGMFLVSIRAFDIKTVITRHELVAKSALEFFTFHLKLQLNNAELSEIKGNQSQTWHSPPSLLFF